MIFLNFFYSGSPFACLVIRLTVRRPYLEGYSVNMVWLEKILKKNEKRAFDGRIAQGCRFAARAEHAGYSSSLMVLPTFRRNLHVCVCVFVCIDLDVQ